MVFQGYFHSSSGSLEDVVEVTGVFNGIFMVPAMISQH